MAGLSVAVVAVPQAMAYALIAGVPPVYGLYTVIVQAALGAVFNSQKFLSVGPINTQALLTASIVQRLSGSEDPATYLGYVVTLTLLKGLIQLAMASLRLGHLVRFVSQSVVVGFTAGAGVLIAVGQVPSLLGFSASRTDADWPGLVGAVQRTVRGLEQTSATSVGIGLGCLAVLWIAQRTHRMAPGPLLAVLAGAAAVALIGAERAAFARVPEMPSGFRFEWPGLRLDQPDALVAGAVALALLGLLEAYSIGRSIGQRTGERVSANAELFGQGVVNFLSYPLWCIPGSGSFSRSALNHRAGAKTAFSSLFASGFVLIAFLMLADSARLIPMASIAAVLFVIAYGLIDWRYVRRIRKADPADAAVCVATFAATLLAPLQYAVFLGIFLNLALYLRRASQLHLIQMSPTGHGPFTERPIHDRSGRERVLLLQVEGNLFFAQADALADALASVAQSGTQAAVLRLKRTHSIDATCLDCLERFVLDMQERGKHVVLCGVTGEMDHRLRRFGLVGVVGKANYFETELGVFASTRRALDRARELVGVSIDVDALDVDVDEDEPATPASAPPEPRPNG
ncbi:MAG: SulP family inorganic anion transporter [Planctomycetota bacterium]